jgi:predicted RNA methylase
VTVALIDDGHEMELARLRDYEVDYTPGPVTRQGVEWALRTLSMSYASRKRVLDQSAGAGVFGQQIRPLLHDPFIWAVEPRFEEKGNLKRHYDEVEACRFEDADFDDEPFDLACTNPPFSLWATILERSLDLVHDDGAVLLYGAIAWGQSSEGAKVFSRFRPAHCARVVGRVHHRGPGLNPKTKKPWGADQRDVGWWLWRKRSTPRTWSTENLPELSPEARKWVVKPGTEAAP